jgi:hypothetical protein
VAAVFVLLAACGGGGTPRAGGSNGTPGGSSSPGSNGSPAPGSSSPAAPGPTATVTPKTTAGGNPSSTPTFTSTASLDKACVHRGVTSDRQGITVHTHPGGPAGFNTFYSDGSSSVDKNSPYKSGYDGGFADSTGLWRSTWVVPKQAPPGKATVRLATQDGFLDLPFKVVTQNGTCP